MPALLGYFLGAVGAWAAVEVGLALAHRLRRRPRPREPAPRPDGPPDARPVVLSLYPVGEGRGIQLGEGWLLQAAELPAADGGPPIAGYVLSRARPGGVEAHAWARWCEATAASHPRPWWRHQQ